MIHETPVTQYMTKNLITFDPDMDIRDAMKILIKNGISGAPVVNEKYEMVGILSERDCIRTVVDGVYNQRPSGTGKVSEYMSTAVKSISADSTVMDAAYQFVHSPYRRFPVIENGKLVGQISRSDVLRAVEKLKPHINIVPPTWQARQPQP